MNLLNWLIPMERQAVINGIRFTIGYSQEDAQTRYRVDMLSIPAISSAIEIKSNDVMQIPLHVYLKTNNGRVRQPSRLDYQLSQQPNRFMNAATFWKTVGMQASVGECFISMRGGELNILPYGSAIRYTNSAGEVRYATTYTKTELQQLGYSNPDTTVIRDDYSYGEVLHFWTYQDEYGNPIPMRTRFRHILGLGSDLYGYTCNVYNRGGVITGYLSNDGRVDEPKKKEVIQVFKSLFKRSRAEHANNNDNLMAALDNGWKYNRLDLTPQEMMLIETKNDLQRDFAQITNMPLWKLGVLDSYKYASAEIAQRDYLQSSLNPLLYQIEREINAKCIAPYERDYLYVEFDREALIDLDAKTKAEIDDMAVKNGCMSTDEWRERRNLAHAGQDIRQIPVNVTSANYVAANEALKLQSAQLDLQLKQAQLAALQKPPTLTLPAPTPPAPNPPATSPDDSIDEDSIDTDSVTTVDNSPQALEAAGQSAIPDPGKGGPLDSIGANVAPENMPTFQTPIGTPTPADGMHDTSGSQDTKLASQQQTPQDETANVILETPINYVASLKDIQAKYAADVDADKMKDPDTMTALVRSVVGEVAQLHQIAATHLENFAAKYAGSANNRIANAGSANHPYEMNRMVNAANHEAMKLSRGINTQVKWAGGANDGQVKGISETWAGTLRHPPLTDDETDCYLVPA